MNLRQLRIGLRAGCAMLWLACTLVVCWAFLWDDAERGPDSEPDGTRAASMVSRAAKAALPSLQQFQQVWRKPLRRPLFDPPPAATAARTSTPPPQAPLRIKLLGTVLEPGQSMAMFAVPPGTITIKRVGEAIGEAPNQAEIMDIQTDRAVLRCQGQTMTVEIEGTKGK